MAKPSDDDSLAQGIVGLGEGSIRKSYWRQLRRSSVELERFRLLLDRTQDLIMLVEADTEAVIDVNAACGRLGWRPEELIGRPVRELVAAGFESLMEAMAAGQGWGPREPQVMQLRRPDESLLPVELSWEIARLDGRPYAVLVGRDIAKRLAAEEVLRTTIDELSRSNAELERFAYVASHDLKEPLRTVISFAQLLQRQCGDCLSGEARESLAYMVDGARRMHALVSDLLDYSRIMGKASCFEAVDMTAVVETVLTGLREALDEAQAVVTLRGPLPLLHGDRAQMQQLMQNLISNAVKFRRPDLRPEVRISAQRWGREWWIAVSDNGIGIEEPYLDKIFQVFTRLHTVDRYPGTGVGLAICKAVVERHKGRIWVESLPGQGTTVTCALPADTVE